MNATEFLEATRATLAHMDDAPRTFDAYYADGSYAGQVEAFDSIEAEQIASDRWSPRAVSLEEV